MSHKDANILYKDLIMPTYKMNQNINCYGEGSFFFGGKWCSKNNIRINHKHQINGLVVVSACSHEGLVTMALLLIFSLCTGEEMCNFKTIKINLSDFKGSLN